MSSKNRWNMAITPTCGGLIPWDQRLHAELPFVSHVVHAGRDGEGCRRRQCHAACRNTPGQFDQWHQVIERSQAVHNHSPATADRACFIGSTARHRSRSARPGWCRRPNAHAGADARRLRCLVDRVLRASVILKHGTKYPPEPHRRGHTLAFCSVGTFAGSREGGDQSTDAASLCPGDRCISDGRAEVRNFSRVIRELAPWL